MITQEEFARDKKVAQRLLGSHLNNSFNCQTDAKQTPGAFPRRLCDNEKPGGLSLTAEAEEPLGLAG